MKGKVCFLVALVLFYTILIEIFLPPEAGATPAFTRQMRMDCKSCHFQFFPKLNAFGRAFKLGGYTDVAVDTIDGDWGTSLPANLNMAWIGSIQYNKNVPSSAPMGQYTGKDRGELEIPSEGAFWIGGRVAENFGAKVEVVNGAWETGKIIYSRPVGPVQAGLALFSSEATGPGEGQELFNTGLSMMQRSWINMALTPLSGPLGVNGIYGPAQGITLFAGGDHFFAVAQGWTPASTTSDFGKAMSLYYRGALTYDVLGFDSMIGFFGTAGQSSGTGFNSNGPLSGGLETAKTKSIGMDLQAQGNITKDITLGLTSMLLFDTGDNSPRNIYGKNDNEAYGVNIDLGFLDDRAILKLNYTNQQANFLEENVDVYSVGAQYSIAQNVQLRVSWSFYDGDIDGLGLGPMGGMGGMGNSANDTEFATTLYFAF